MKYLKLLYITIVFHFPVWKPGYKNHKYRFIESFPSWMLFSIKLRNEFERVNSLSNCFYWFKFGRFYIRKNYSHPMKNVFMQSNNHLFVFARKKSICVN